MDKLNFRQIKFIEGIEAGKSLIDAYMDAGYKARREMAYPLASRMIRNVKISAALEARMLNQKTLAEQRLSSMVDGATNTYLRILKLTKEEGSEKLLELQRRVSVDVFDRIGVKPKQDIEIGGVLQINFQLPKGVVEEDI